MQQRLALEIADSYRFPPFKKMCRLSFQGKTLLEIRDCIRKSKAHCTWKSSNACNRTTTLFPTFTSLQTTQKKMNRRSSFWSNMNYSHNSEMPHGWYYIYISKLLYIKKLDIFHMANPSELLLDPEGWKEALAPLLAAGENLQVCRSTAWQWNPRWMVHYTMVFLFSYGNTRY